MDSYPFKTGLSLSGLALVVALGFWGVGSLGSTVGTIIVALQGKIPGWVPVIPGIFFVLFVLFIYWLFRGLEEAMNSQE